MSTDRHYLQIARLLINNFILLDKTQISIYKALGTEYPDGSVLQRDCLSSEREKFDDKVTNNFSRLNIDDFTPLLYSQKYRLQKLVMLIKS